MKPEDKRYIIENIHKESVKKIAEELHLKERKIKKFLEHHKKKEKQKTHVKEIKKPASVKIICFSAALIVILGFLVYANSLGGEFVWDDYTLVKNNVYIRNFSNLAAIFTKPIGEGAGGENAFYRPIQIFSYTVDYALWGLKAIGFHAANIFWHVLAGLSIYWLINILFGNWLVALFTSMLFVVHPVHSEAVAYISGRSDSLGLFFMLLCFIFYIKQLYRNSTKTYIFMLLSYAAALLSRENNLVLPVLLLLYHYTFKKRIKFREFTSVLGLAFIYILSRAALLRYVLPVSSYPTTFLERLPGFFAAVTDYLRLLFIPFNLHMEYGQELFDFAAPKVAIGMIILFLLVVYAVRQRNRNSLVFFSVSWFFITLLPVSNLYPLNAYMAEHWLYTPSVGFFLILAWFFNFFCKKQKLGMLAVFFIIGCYSFLTIRQNSYWNDPVALFERTLNYAPGNARIYYNLGFAYGDKDTEKAISLYKKAIEIDPYYERAYSSLGSVYNGMDRREEAIELFKKAIEVNPAYAAAYYNLGTVYSEMDNRKEAIKMFEKAIEFHPLYVEAYNNLGNIYKKEGDYEKAVYLYKKAVEIDPTCSTAYNNLMSIYKDIDREEKITLLKGLVVSNPKDTNALNSLGNAYNNMGNKEQAIVYYKKAIKVDPRSIEAYNNLGNTYHSIGKVKEAVGLFEKAIEINPMFLEAYYNLGNVYRDIGRHNQAIAMFEKALELKPDYIEARNNLGIEYVKVGRPEQAIRAFEKIIEINPEYRSAYKNLAVVFYNSGQYLKAIEYYDKALELGYTPDPEFMKRLERYRD